MRLEVMAYLAFCSSGEFFSCTLHHRTFYMYLNSVDAGVGDLDVDVDVDVDADIYDQPEE